MDNAVVLYPAPGMGHLASLTELSVHLLRHSPHLSVHLLLLPTTDAAVDSFLLHHTPPNLTVHRLPSPTSPPLSFPNPSPAAVAFDFIRRSAENVRGVLWRIREKYVVKALVMDFFCTSAMPVAEEMGVPVYYFFTSGAAALAVYLYFLMIDREVSGSFKDLVSTQLRIPGLPILRAIDMPEPILDRNDPAYNDILHFSLSLPKSKGIIVNTFENLEPIPIRSIANGSCVPNSPTPPVHYIGPIISQHNKSDETKHECLKWLDSQPSKSVVFLCFGSRGSFSLDQVKEIANGLEQSGHRFLWVVKSPPSEEKTMQNHQIGIAFDVDTIVPHGFLERTRGRGMVVGSWAPQTQILSHGSVGGFVTHCGWNSVLEAVIAGVPMIAWPLYAEQYVNRAALVEDMKMAIDVEQREGDGFVSGTEVERRVKEMMDSEKGKEVREKSETMKQEALAAWGDTGSSTTALANLMRIWS